jgi:hypothetical protein
MHILPLLRWLWLVGFLLLPFSLGFFSPFYTPSNTTAAVIEKALAIELNAHETNLLMRTKSSSERKR